MKQILSQKSRVRVLFVGSMFLVALLIFRLFQIQIVSHEKYTEIAYREQVKKLVIPAKRGLIYAMDGATPTPIVMNNTVYKMYIDPVVVKDKEAIKQALYQEAREQIFQEAKLDEKFENKKSRYQVVALDLTRQQAEALRAKKLTGVGFQALSKRVYPEDSLASQTLGFVNADGLGQYGVEGGLNQRLAGTDGLLESVTDISQVPLTIGEQNTHTPAVDGDNIVLSIDTNIQAKLEEIVQEHMNKYQADNISVLVMNPNNGKIMAMANAPNYSPADYTKVTDASLFNNAVTMLPYESGSVIKTFTMAMGINEGIVNPSSTYYNSDSVQVADRKIVNAIRGRTGMVTMQDVMTYSLNTGVVEILARAGGGQINKKATNLLYAYFHDRFRFGEVTGAEVPNAKGIIISPSHQEGNAVRYSNMTFGQGLNLTMLQVGTAFSSLVNGGYYYQPSIVNGIILDERFVADKAPEASGQILKESTSKTLRQMMTEARRKDGTGAGDPAGFEIGGKTGTSETLEDGKYIKTQTIASYLGYGGGAKPEYVIMVQVGAKGRYLTGNAYAAPIFGQVSNWLLQYLKIQPKE